MRNSGIPKCKTKSDKVYINIIYLSYRNDIHFSIVNGVYYYLISIFITFSEATNVSTACLCTTCFDAVNKRKIPRYSLANGVDYGDAIQLALEVLTIPEQYLIALGRVYETVLKLNRNQN